ncbi:MAG: hypothetical protein K2X90_03470 [Candidatus Babeliaceae bacterium]|nr:hypothetical protein [Candidatus Babeliaceae bacterium]
MKKIVLLLLSTGSLYAADTSGSGSPEEARDQNVLPPKKRENEQNAQAEKMRDWFNECMRSEENKKMVEAVLYAGNEAWQKTRALFYDGEEVKYGNVSLALALGAGYLLGRRFSGIGTIRRQLAQLTTKVDRLPNSR